MSPDHFGQHPLRFANLKLGQFDAQSVELGAQVHGQAEEETGATKSQHARNEHLHRLDNHESLAR